MLTCLFIPIIFSAGLIVIVIVFSKSQIKKQQDIYKAVLNTQEIEQNRIGQDLHDEINPNIYASKLRLESLLEKVSKKDIEEEILSVVDILNTTGKLVRTASHNLNLDAFSNGPIDEIIEGFCMSIDSSDHIIKLEQSESLNWISRENGTQLFRIIKELLHNSLKHSNASQTTLSISSDSHLVTIQVADNGTGSTEKIDRNGIGISNIRNRVELFNGKFEINNNRAGTGLCFTIRIGKNKLI